MRGSGWLFCLVVACSSSSGGSGSSGPLTPRDEWFGSAPLQCKTPDVCSVVNVHCKDTDGPGALQGCIDGRCLKGAAFGQDFCASFGGVKSGSTFEPLACPEGPDRQACVDCRGTQGPACVVGPCAATAQALTACMAPGSEALPAGVERVDWRYQDLDTGKRVACDPEANAFEKCVADNCPDLVACGSAKAPSPQAPSL
ncbi:MAG: hypothetical protein R3B13_21130 [Polyangiaceae bacterium]